MTKEEIYMQGYFDIHAHILPGVDDGAKNLDETFRMLYIAYEEGIRVIVATPHFIAGNQNVPVEKILELFYEVSQAVKKAGIMLNIILGNELLYNMDMIDSLNRGDALTIDGTRYILVEFPIFTSFREMWKGLNHCIFAGYIPILAHVERYPCLINDPSFVGNLIDLGAYIQVDLSSIEGKITDPKVRFCHKLLKKEWVHFLGTDAHGAYDRVPRAKRAIAFLKRKYGENKVIQLLWENPMTMLEDKHL
jgi:protein-tyrosine phosphatase